MCNTRLDDFCINVLTKIGVDEFETDNIDSSSYCTQFELILACIHM